MIKFVACDLDGTLLSSQHELTEKTIVTLKDLSENSNVTVSIATGRYLISCSLLART